MIIEVNLRIISCPFHIHLNERFLMPELFSSPLLYLDKSNKLEALATQLSELQHNIVQSPNFWNTGCDHFSNTEVETSEIPNPQSGTKTNTALRHVYTILELEHTQFGNVRKLGHQFGSPQIFLDMEFHYMQRCGTYSLQYG